MKYRYSNEKYFRSLQGVLEDTLDATTIVSAVRLIFRYFNEIEEVLELIYNAKYDIDFGELSIKTVTRRVAV